MKFSNFVVIMVVLLNTAFVVGVFYASLQNATIPDSLIIAWFAFTTGELFALASIKKTKVKKLRREKNE